MDLPKRLKNKEFNPDGKILLKIDSKTSVYCDPDKIQETLDKWQKILGISKLKNK